MTSTPMKSGKKPRRAGAPRRALSAYMFFSHDWRERIKTESPSLSFGEVGKLLAARRKELDERGRRPYVEQAATDASRYEMEMERFKAQTEA
ncbi:hypothetical protein ACF06X_32745 [Streptomyces sp. NPDC015346]|uniref:hypothetical protein n=1 Tax=Streptomyces sp. NPDC015346 TaxID=3364954 RepID=UPI0036F5E7A5